MSDDEAQARLDNYLSHMLEAVQLARQCAQSVSKGAYRRRIKLSRSGDLTTRPPVPTGRR